MLEIYIMPNFVKIVRVVLEIVNIYICIYNFSSFNNKWGLRKKITARRLGKKVICRNKKRLGRNYIKVTVVNLVQDYVRK